MIEPGQTYRSCDPNDRYPTRILIKGVIPYGAAQWGRGTANVVTVTQSGRELRLRSISLRKLHDSPTTKTGQRRRTGYALETT